MLTKPNFLVSIVLKVKYFEKQSILEAIAPRNSSWFWQSILTAKNLKKKGSTIRIRDGKSINIWQDKWIPFGEDGRVKTPRPLNCNLEIVNQLMTGRVGRVGIKEATSEAKY